MRWLNNLRMAGLAILVSMGLSQGSCGVQIPGGSGACPVTSIDPGFVASASVGVVGPGVIRGCEVSSRTEFRATVRGVSGPSPAPVYARFGIVGANFNGAPCTASSTQPWLPNSSFSASTLPCATPSSGTYFGDLIVLTPVLTFNVRSAF